MRPVEFRRCRAINVVTRATRDRRPLGTAFEDRQRIVEMQIRA